MPEPMTYGGAVVLKSTRRREMSKLMIVNHSYGLLLNYVKNNITCKYTV